MKLGLGVQKVKNHDAVWYVALLLLISFCRVQMKLGLHLVLNNRRCCCKETPSTTGWNHDIFTRTILESCFSASTFHTSVYCVKRVHFYQERKCMLCELGCHKCRGRTLHDRAFLKTTFEWSALKLILISSSRWWRFLSVTSAVLPTIILVLSFEIYCQFCITNWSLRNIVKLPKLVQSFEHPGLYSKCC